MNSEATSPAMSEMASPWKMGSNKITAAPTTTAIAVSSIGRKRTAPASTTASASGIPSARRCSMKSTRIAQHRLRLGDRGCRDAVPRFHVFELLLRDRLLREQTAQTLGVPPVLLAQRQRLVQAGLDLARIKSRKQLPCFDGLAG